MYAVNTAQLFEAREAVQRATPLVQCLTNVVVPQVTANVLLAIDATPAMVDGPHEAAQFAAVASAVLINVGTPTGEQSEAMRLAARAAHEEGTPWVLDPVAVGGLEFRTQLAKDLLQYRPSAIRGNASEIVALAGLGAGGRGVDATDSVDAAREAAIALSRSTGAVVAISGEQDLVVYAEGDEVGEVRVTSGHVLMQKVIGTGCALGAAVAAYLGAADQGAAARITAVAAAHAHLSAAGSMAGATTSGPGSFAVAWLDALASVERSDLEQWVQLNGSVDRANGQP